MSSDCRYACSAFPNCGCEVESLSPPAHITARAKIVAAILTDNGHPVTPPDEASLDDVEWERWRVCLEIVHALAPIPKDAKTHG